MEVFEVAYSPGIPASLEVDSDCRILAFSWQNEYLQRVFEIGARIVMINAELIGSRGELRICFAELDNTSVGKPIKVGVERYARESVPLENSVICDDTVSFVRGNVPMAAEELPDEPVLADASASHEQLLVTDKEKSKKQPLDSLFSAVEESYLDDSHAILAAVDKATPGRSIIIISEGTNPASVVETAANEKKIELVTFDLGRKLGGRRTAVLVTECLIDALRNGKWLLLIRADKSISSLRSVDSTLKESKDHALEGVHPQARLIISTAPHPHFPPGLVSGCVILRAQSSSDFLAESMHGSMSCVRILRGVSSIVDDEPKKVRISSTLQIVDIDPREMFRSPVSLSSQKVNVSSTVQLQVTFEGVPNEKFLCVSSLGQQEGGHIAAASSFGNVYFLDDVGDVLHTIHAHDASIWDMCFASKFDFLTGSEDGTAIRWVKTPSELALEPKSTVKCGADVYAVKFFNPGSMFIVAGTMRAVYGVKHTGQTITYPTTTSGQCIAVIPEQDQFAVGGGDGSVTLFDASTASVQKTLRNHQKKVPCIARSVENQQLITGSFDKTIQTYDLRVGKPHHTLRLKDYVTGLGADGNILAACVGENMYIWDCRNVAEVYGGCASAWKSLTRGLVVDSVAQTIVTASADGFVRFWGFR